MRTSHCDLFSFPGILAGGTNMGKVAMWHAVKHKSNVDGEKRWELFPPSIIQEPVLQLQVGKARTKRSVILI